MAWATVWAFFSQNHLVTLVPADRIETILVPGGFVSEQSVEME
jgi:hypothetical protein